jgi:hypothetical protein
MMALGFSDNGDVVFIFYLCAIQFNIESTK